MFNRTRLLRMALGVTLGWASITLNAQTVNKTFSNQTLKTVLKEVETQTGMSIVYKTDEVNVDKKVSVKFTDASIDYVLSKVLDKSLTWHIQDKMIVITKKQKSSVSDKKITVTGKVLDSQNMPIIGASVVVKGTSNGTISDFDGNFSFTAPENSLIEVSYIGYKSQQLTAVDERTLSIIMKEDTEVLDEVVVVGFGTQKKVNLTGAVSAVGSEVLESRPVNSVSDMLQGTIAGLNITSSSGLDMDATPSINIRGTGTIGEGSTGAPLVLIDGMEGDLTSINPQDIENISVLKDATSSSIYGSRAPFGVILVTTKRGKEGKTSVNYNNSLRWRNPINLPEMMDSYTFANYFNDAETNMGRKVWFDQQRIDDILAYQRGEIKEAQYKQPGDTNFWGDGYAYGIANTDHYDNVYRDVAFTHEHNLSVQGGNEKLNYYVSANYLNSGGFFAVNQDRVERLTATAKINAKLYSWLSFNFTNRFISKNFDYPTILSEKKYRDDFYKTLGKWPTAPDFDPNGNPYSSTPRDNGTSYFALSEAGASNRSDKWLYQQYQLVIEPIKNWKTFVDFNYRNKASETTNELRQSYNIGVDNKTQYPVSRESYVKETRYSENYINLNVYSEYSHTFNQAHNLKVMAGFQMEQNEFGDVSLRRDGIIVPGLTSIDTTDGLSYDGKVISPMVSGKYQDWATAGFFGRINYDYMERYLMEVNLRYDGSSRFRGDERWGLFPSVSLGWNIAREKFFEDYTDIFGTLKLRASYGELGNQNTSNYYPTYRVVPLNMSSGKYLINGIMPNTTAEPALIYSGLTWERIKNWNFGFDVSALSGRLTASFDYFIRDTKDMVGPAPELPDLFGFTVPKQNNTDLRTKGYEISVNWRDRLDCGFSYGIGLSLSDSQTKITSYPNEANLLSKYRTGQMLGEIWGFETVGIAKTDEEMNNHLASLPNGGQNNIGSQWQAGDIMYKDLNGDGKISKGGNSSDDPGDLKIIGNNTPRYAFGFSLDASYKGFDIRAFFQGILKRDYYIDGPYFWGAYKNMWEGVSFVEHADYFRADPEHPLGQNLDAYYPRPLFGGNTLKNQQCQTRYLQNAAYMRLKNLQLGYTFPKSLIQKAGIQNLRIFISGENLFTITSLSDIFDPETLSGGYMGSAYPLSRTWSCGLNVTF